MGFLWIAISLGFLGSFHCVGMCGPIAMALPVHHLGWFKKILGILTYNLGRSLTYAAIGSLFGLLGQGFVMIGLQRYLSISLGIFILASVFIPQHVISKYKISNRIFQFFNQIKNNISSLFSRQKFSSLFFIGVLNGLLPCGLVYMSMAGAVASGNILNGALFMFFFGLGTLPLMLSVSWFSHLISLSFRSTVRKLVPYVMSVMAVMLILRGMNLGIPYLSPSYTISESTDATHTKVDFKCHPVKP